MDGFRVEDREFLSGLNAYAAGVMARVGEYGRAAGERLAEWARNPPFPYAPERRYTEREIVRFKTLAKRGKLRIAKRESQEGPYRWRDRSGEARKSITGGAEWDGARLDIYVCGGTEYFPHLELGNEKRYAVLAPAVEALAPGILEQMSIAEWY